MNTRYRLRLRSVIHEAIANILTEESYAIDATAGNGYDTLFLCQHIHATKHIYAFDIQYQAITSTYQRLQDNGMLDKVTLFNIGHQCLYSTLSFFTNNSIPLSNAIMFNLGYLPHSDKRCITQPTSTIQALTQALSLLAPYGILSIHTYHEHQGGLQEYQAIQQWITMLPSSQYPVFTMEQINKKTHREVLFLLQYTPAILQNKQ